MENYVVTFARGFGTGGKEIASKLAKELGIHCYENRILTLASQMSGLDEKLFQEVNEKVRSNGGFSSFLKGLPRAKAISAGMRSSCPMISCLSIRRDHLELSGYRIVCHRWKVCRLHPAGQTEYCKHLHRGTT